MIPDSLFFSNLLNLNHLADDVHRLAIPARHAL